MFAPYCPVHGCKVLLTAKEVRSVANLAPGVIAVELECYDGERLFLLTGRAINLREPVDHGDSPSA